MIYLHKKCVAHKSFNFRLRKKTLYINAKSELCQHFEVQVGFRLAQKKRKKKSKSAIIFSPLFVSNLQSPKATVCITSDKLE